MEDTLKRPGGVYDLAAVLNKFKNTLKKNLAMLPRLIPKHASAPVSACQVGSWLYSPESTQVLQIFLIRSRFQMSKWKAAAK